MRLSYTKTNIRSQNLKNKKNSYKYFEVITLLLKLSIELYHDEVRIEF